MDDYSPSNRKDESDRKKKKKAKVTKPQNVNTVRFNIPDDHKQARLNSGNNRSEQWFPLWARVLKKHFIYMLKHFT